MLSMHAVNRYTEKLNDRDLKTDNELQLQAPLRIIMRPFLRLQGVLYDWIGHGVTEQKTWHLTTVCSCILQQLPWGCKNAWCLKYQHDGVTRVNMMHAFCSRCQSVRIKSLWTSAKTQRSSNQRWAHSSLWHNVKCTNTNGLKKLLFFFLLSSIKCSGVFGQAIFITGQVVWISDALITSVWDDTCTIQNNITFTSLQPPVRSFSSIWRPHLWKMKFHWSSGSPMQ